MRIAYITSCFGSLSHTFIRREIRELRRLGIDIRLYGIRPDVSSDLPATDRPLIENTRYLYPLSITKVILANFYFLFRKPRTYLRAFWLALFNEERGFQKHLKMIYHFFVSAYLSKIMADEGVEHIHAHFLNVSSSIAMYCAQTLGISYSVTVHSAGTASLDHMIGLKAKLKHARMIMVISRYNVKYINDIYPCEHKTHVVRCGIDLDEYPYEPPPDGEDRPARLLSVGRFVEKKGFSYLVEAAERLREKGVPFCLTMIGDGVLKNDVDDMVKRRGLTDTVSLTGALPPEEIKRRVLDHDIFIVPSVETTKGEKEGIPVVIMESLALGRPVIATQHSGIPEIIRDRITGLLVPEKDPDAIRDAVFAFRSDKRLRSECASNGRRVVEEEFNIKREALKLKNLFESNHA